MFSQTVLAAVQCYCILNRSTLSFRKIIPLDQWEVLPEQVEYKDELGRGAFGIVYKGTLKKRAGIEVFETGKKPEPKEPFREVAIKVLPGSYTLNLP